MRVYINAYVWSGTHSWNTHEVSLQASGILGEGGQKYVALHGTCYKCSQHAWAYIYVYMYMYVYMYVYICTQVKDLITDTPRHMYSHEKTARVDSPAQCPGQRDAFEDCVSMPSGSCPGWTGAWSAVDQRATAACPCTAVRIPAGLYVCMCICVHVRMFPANVHKHRRQWCFVNNSKFHASSSNFFMTIFPVPCRKTARSFSGIKFMFPFSLEGT